MVMEVLLEKKRPLSALAGEVSIYPQLLKIRPRADKKAARENPRVQAAVKAVEEALGENGRILVRGKRHRAGDPHYGGGTDR